MPFYYTPPPSNGFAQFITAQDAEKVTLPIGMYDKIIVQGDDGTTFDIGLTEGGNEIAEGLIISDGFATFTQDMKFTDETDIYFTGFVGDELIKIRKL